MTKRKNEIAPRPAAKKTGLGKSFRCPYSAAEIEEIFRRFSVQRPEPTTELHYTNPYTLLVAVALSAQMTDAGVNKATRPLFAKVDTPQKMLDLGEEDLREAIRTINFHRNKARNVIAMARRLIEDFDGEVPRSREALESLPGVGRKTANVMLATVFGEPALAVDTHIFRIGNRLKLAPGKTPDEVEENFLRIIPKKYLPHAHHWLILHGRYTCKARRPECEHCIIADLCKSPEKTCDVPAELVELPPQVI
jgi:endonuclease-3